MAGYLVQKPIKALGIGLERSPGQQVSQAEFANAPALLQALIDEGALTPIGSGGMNALVAITGMKATWAAAYYAYGFRTPADIAGATVEELRQVEGVGPATANDLKAAAQAVTG